MGELKILHVAVPVPLRRLFDYLPPDNQHSEIRPGVRVRISFGHHVLVGIVVSVDSTTAFERSKLKAVLGVIDQQALCQPNFASRYALKASKYLYA